MTLRRLASLIVLATMLAALGAAHLFSRQILQNRFLGLELREANAHADRLQTLINTRLDALRKSAVDYAQWDDTYQALVGTDPSQYLSLNFDSTTLSNLGVQQALLVDTSFKVLVAVENPVDSDSGEAWSQQWPVGLEHAVQKGLRVHSTDALNAGVAFLAQGSEGAFTVAIARVMPSSRLELAPGFLVFAHPFGDNELQSLSEDMALSIQFGSVDSNAIQQSQQKTHWLALGNALGTRWLHRSSANNTLHQIYARVGLGDGIWLQLQVPAELKVLGEDTQRVLFTGIILVVLVLWLTLFFALDSLVLRPVAMLQKRFAQLANNDNLSVRMEPCHAKELNDLNHTINSVLDDLQSSHIMLRTSEKVHRELASELRKAYDFLANLVDFLPDAAFAVDNHGTILAWNQAMAQLTGRASSAMLGGNVDEIALAMYGEPRHVLINKVMGGEFIDSSNAPVEMPDGSFSLEEFVVQPHAPGRFLSHVAAKVRDSSGQVLGALQLVRDVTDKKRAEMRLEYLSLHDSLTGLHNRTWHDESLPVMQKPEKFPLGVVMVDIDGLKLVNDTLGHNHGDALISAAAGVLKHVFDHRPLVRMGGDEFLAYMPQSNEEQVKESIRQLGQAIRVYNDSRPPIPLFLSVGYAWHADPCPLTELIGNADVAMYRDKDNRRSNVRKDYVESLRFRFEESQRIEEDPCVRIEQLSARLAEFLGWDEGTIERVRRLSRFRDLGKVGIPENLLQKPGALEPDEQEELKKQPEIGFRIARISDKLQDIADLILKHREWWNGAGYPFGLAGEQIPAENRLVAVVETYVSMTTPRLRKATSSPQEALQEVQKMSGAKLDPSLVSAFVDFHPQAC